MPRRAPPSALRLVPGPTPPRNAPKHTMPSVPRPTFYPQSILAKDCADVPYLPSTLTQSAAQVAQAKIRGPWDHSGSIKIPLDEGNLLAPLKPVAVM
ncbi:hypothetical protein Moror_2029 [Moniliophthora roreri MCA 2997]|uniref:Uncharacterized protein n=1 Tax=Moniliophthora roreri (strain MCA 2997) TaxID=1381753 RepID=V2Y790_MONRO|nr:hypothetical protein Moror_2029 [Moniliophthora roreri MCA 2997]